jgi:hypothetical protein
MKDNSPTVGHAATRLVHESVHVACASKKNGKLRLPNIKKKPVILATATGEACNCWLGRRRAMKFTGTPHTHST